MKRALRIVAQAVTAALVLLVWQKARTSGHLSADFGEPSEIGRTLGDWLRDGTLRDAALSSLRVLLVGWALGTLIGSLVGMLIGTSPVARQICEPFLMFIYGMPRLILQPFFVIWLGFGVAPKVGLVVMTIWIITTVSVAQGCRQIPGELLSNARLLGADRWRLARDVYAPSLALWVLSSSRVTFGLAFQATIVAEFVGSNEGLGHLITLGQVGFRVNDIYAALVVVMVLSMLGNALLTLAEQRATRWMPSRL
jgi:NitT/TauT family transport system permease protein